MKDEIRITVEINGKQIAIVESSWSQETEWFCEKVAAMTEKLLTEMGCLKYFELHMGYKKS